MDQNKLAAVGAATLLLGMQHVTEILQAAMAEQQHILDTYQKTGMIGNGIKRRGRPPKAIAEAVEKALVPQPASPKEQARTKISKFQRGYWAKMTPEEKAAEVARRMKGKASKKRSASNRGNVGNYWAAMTPEQRKTEMRRRIALRGKKKATA